MITSEMNFNTNTSYKVDGNTITFNNTISLDLSAYERDDKVHIDICETENGMLIIGVVPGFAAKYAAQIDIPARRYKTVIAAEVGSGDEDEDEEMFETLVPLPFDMDNVVLSI